MFAFVDRLLDLISQILSGQSYRPLGAPPQYPRTEISAFSREIATVQVRHCSESAHLHSDLTVFI